MILLDIKAYIKQHQNVSAENLQNHFELSADALEGLLAPLIKQGHIQPISACSSQCGTGCASHSKTYYQWLDKKHPSLNIAVEIH